MKETHQTFTTIISFVILLTFTNAAFAEDTCIIKWWGDKNGWGSTSETTRTQQAAEEALQLIFNELSHTCYTDSCVSPDPMGACYGYHYTIFFDGSWSRIFLNSCSGPPGSYIYGDWDVVCGPDSDGDSLPDTEDNCPNVSNPLQEDADNDGTGDVCDNNTIYGYISGDAQEGINVGIYRPNCGGDVLVDTTTTNSVGYYSFNGLSNGWHTVIPDNDSYTFTPELDNVKIPQAMPQSYDFMSNCISFGCGASFVDNGDGTVTDERTGVVWLKNAQCTDTSAEIDRSTGYLTWYDAETWSSGLADGACGLTDGSEAGEWRQPTIEELQGIITDPPETWEPPYPSGAFSIPGAPFVNVQTTYYWSGEESSTYYAWTIYMYLGLVYDGIMAGTPCEVWPVRDNN